MGCLRALDYTQDFSPLSYLRITTIQDLPLPLPPPPVARNRPAALAGRLSAREFLGLLHVLSQSTRSGRLTLTSHSARALLILRRGRLIYAASTSARETLGNILFCERLIDEETLQRALEIQHQAQHQRRLGTVLEEMGAVTRESLTLVVELQARRVMQEILAWESGFFHFESINIDESGEIAVELDDFIVDQGLRIESMLLDLSVSPALRELQQQAAPDPDENALDNMNLGPSLSLRAAMQQIAHPLFNAEMTLAVMDYASSMLERGVLLIRRSNRLLGMAQFGIDHRGSHQPVIRRVSLSLDEDSEFRVVVERGGTHRGALAESEVSTELLDRIGRPSQQIIDAVIIPLVVRDEVVAVFYGDTTQARVRSVISLEALMMQASLAIEKSLLENKVQALEEKLVEQREKEPNIAPPTPFRAPSFKPTPINDLLSGKVAGAEGG